MSDSTNGTVDCHEIFCYNTAKTGRSPWNVVTGLVTDIIIGALCLLGFVVWRSSFPVYHARLLLPNVPRRPPKMRLDGLHRIWSWLVPVFTINDAELLRQCGLDALASLRVVEFGILLLLPLTFFGIAVLLPVNYISDRSTTDSSDSTSLDSVFLAMTISNIPNRSSLLWVPFCYVILCVGWASYLLLRYHKAHMSLSMWYEFNPESEIAQGIMPSEPDTLAEETLALTSSTSAGDQAVEIQSKNDSRRRRSASATGQGSSSPLENAGDNEDPLQPASPEPSATVDVEAAPLRPASHCRRRARGSSAAEERLARDSVAAREVVSLLPRPHSVLSVDGVPCPTPRPGRYAVLVLDAAEQKYRFSEEGTLPGASVMCRRSHRAWPAFASRAWHALSLGSEAAAAAEGGDKERQGGADDVDDERSRDVKRANGSTELRSHGAVGDPATVVVGDDGAAADTAPKEPGNSNGNDRVGAKAMVAFKNAGDAEKKDSGTDQSDNGGETANDDDEDAIEWHLVHKRVRCASEVFGRVFGDDFVTIVPIFDFKAVDKLTGQLFWARLARDDLQLKLRDAEALAPGGMGSEKQIPSEGRPGEDNHNSSKLGWFVTWWQHQKERKRAKLESQLTKVNAGVEQLELELTEARRAAPLRPPKSSFFALFRTQEAAAFAAGVNVNPPDEHLMRIVPSPEPADINWPTLLRGWKQRVVRPALAFPLVIGIMIFPIGLFTGAFTQMNVAICGSSSSDDSSSSSGGSQSWYCSDDWFATLLRNLVTGFLPSLLLSVYQAVFLPLAFYVVALGEANAVSLVDLDARCGQLFFYWIVFNYFLGALLGGSLLAGIRAFIDNPNQIWTLLGQAIPASSNFFTLYVMFRGLSLVPFRLFWPAASVIVFIFKWLRLVPWARTSIGKALEVPARNIRYSRDIGVIVLGIYIAVLAYAPITPFILPFGLIYFMGMWTVWRYQVLYVYQPTTNGRGRVWQYFAHRLLACLLIQVIFTAAMFIVKGGYVQAGLLLGLMGFHLYLMNRWLTLLDRKAGVQSLHSKHAAGPAMLSPQLFMPPPLRADADRVWFPEWGKGWQAWGMPRYGI